MALPLLPLFLLAGAGVGVALIAAKNVRGEDVPIYRRRIAGGLLPEDGDAPRFAAGADYWRVTDAADRNIGEGNAGNRKANLLAEIATTRQHSSQTEGVGFDFFDETEEQAITFRVTVVLTKGGYLLQALDPRATVQLMKVYKKESQAISAGYDFVNKKGY